MADKSLEELHIWREVIQPLRAVIPQLDYGQLLGSYQDIVNICSVASEIERILVGCRGNSGGIRAHPRRLPGELVSQVSRSAGT